MLSGVTGIVGQNKEAVACNNQHHSKEIKGRGGVECCAIRETMKNCIRETMKNCITANNTAVPANNIAVRHVCDGDNCYP